MSSSVSPTRIFRPSVVTPVVPGTRVRKTSELAPIGDVHAAESVAQVELIKEGDFVQAIDVTCSCGQKTRLWCVYEPE